MHKANKERKKKSTTLWLYNILSRNWEQWNYSQWTFPTCQFWTLQRRGRNSSIVVRMHLTTESDPNDEQPKPEVRKKTISGGGSSNGAWNRCKNRIASAIWLHINVAPFTNHKQPLGAERTPWLTGAPTWRTNDLVEPTAVFGSASRLGICIMESICQAAGGEPGLFKLQIVLLYHISS